MKKLLLPLLLLVITAVGLPRPAQADPLPTHMLWTADSGQISLFTIAPDGRFTYHIYGPYPGWTAKALADGADGLTRILWSNPDTRSILWNVTPDGNFTIVGVYGPYPGWTSVAISALVPAATTATGPAGGDLSGTFPNPTLASVGTASTYGDATHVPVFTTDAKGRVIGVTPTLISFPAVPVTSVFGRTGAVALTASDVNAALGYTPLSSTDPSMTNSRTPSGPAGGDLTGVFPNPTVAANAIDHTKLASDFGSLAQVSGGLISTNDNSHVNVKNDLYVKGTVIALIGNGGGTGNNGGVGRAIVDGGPANNLIINYANDFGRVSVQSDLAIDGGLNLGTGEVNSSNDVNIRRNTTVRGVFGVTSNINCSGNVDATGYISTKSTLYANTLQLTGGADVAEPYKIAAFAAVKPIPGMVVAIDPQQTGQMRVCAKAYDNTVGGIISGANGIQPGVVLRQAGTVADGSLPIASIGRVWCWCDADANGAISPGDLLTTSDTPGHAMRVRDYDKARGAVLGKAMSSLKTGKGLVLVLVSLQ